MKRSLRQRAECFDRMWEEAFPDTDEVFEWAKAEGFHPVHVAPPNMFAHDEELRRLVSFRTETVVRELEANPLACHGS